MTTTTTIKVRGPFELRESATFGFGQRLDTAFDGIMRMAFRVDGSGYAQSAGVAVRQDGAAVHVDVHAAADPDVVTAQVARVLSLDHDGEEFVAVGRRDPVIGRLQAVAPGLRPPQFHSPYEAAAWSVLSARRPARQMAEVRRRLSEQHGERFELAGETWWSFPAPERLLAVEEIPGLSAEKVTRLQAIGRAAADGRLDVARLVALEPEEAMAALRELPGIGRFYASLIVIRACGLADVLVVNEATANESIGRLYGLPGRPGEDRIGEIAEQWRPFRTWAAVLVRAAADRLPADARTPSG
jgi:DNA-3-methyladenine glycosylase II